MRRTAFRRMSSGCRARSLSIGVCFAPPGYIVCVKKVLSVSFFPVKRTFSAFTTTTKSPVSIDGVYMGLCLPLRTDAMRVARRPTVFSFASTSHHFRPFRASAFVALWVVPLAMEYPAEIPKKLETRLLEEGRALVKRRRPPRRRGNLAGSRVRHKGGC